MKRSLALNFNDMLWNVKFDYMILDTHQWFFIISYFTQWTVVKKERIGYT
jgi:hypothetical protein